MGQAADDCARSDTPTEWFWETDSNHRYTYVSSHNAVITGFSASQIIGRRREDFAFDREDPKWGRHLADLAAHRPFWGFEYPIKLPCGRLVHLSVSGEPRFDEDGGFLGYRGAASDITQRRLVEQELRDAKELFQAVLDHAPFSIVLKDRHGRYLEVSREWQRRFGMARDEVLGKKPLDVLPSEIAEAYEARDAAALSGGDTFLCEERLEHADRRDEYFLTTHFPTRDRDGGVRGVGLISADISHWKLAELAQAETEQQFRTIADNLPVLIAHLDHQWRYRFINREGARWYGMTPSEVVGKTASEILSGETCDAIRPIIDRVLAGEIARYSGVIGYPDGESREVSISCVPDLAPDGSVQGWFALAQDVTEKERAARAVRHGEEERRTVTDNLPVLMARFDRDWRYRFINREGARWYGMAPEEVVGRTIPELFSQETVDNIRPSVETALRGENARFAGYVRYPDGNTRNTEISFIPDRTPEGKVRGWFALAQDITDWHLATEALRKNEQQLRTITNNLPVLIARLDNQKRFEFINRAGEEWYDRPRKEIIGKTVSEILGSGRTVTAESMLNRALGGEQVQFEEKMQYPDGTIRDVDISYIPDFSPQGEVRGCISLVQNVTEHKGVESRLRESEARLRAIVDNLPAFITHVDRDLRYSFANRVAEEWYGRPASEIIGRQLSEVHKPASLEMLRPRVDAVLAGQDQRFETTLLYPDNITRTVDQRWIADLDENGNTRGWFSLIQDISERKRLEADLLRQERLAAMGQLTGTVAHELRNPLGAVAMSIAALRKRSKDAGLDLERSLARGERGISRCDKIITELLDFARAKGLQLESTRFDEWLSLVIDEQEFHDDVSLSMDTAAGDIEVKIDREDIRRAIINVVDNACHAVADNPGVGRVEISCRVNGNQLNCDIRDNGPGIPAEHLERIMEPLFSTKSFGTGLGLPTVQRIMEEHGGGIRIESEPGQGALVRLWLPLDAAPPSGYMDDST